MTDRTRWIPDPAMEPPDDHHMWVKPAPDDCPGCDCCSKRLCEKAKADGTFCDFLGRNADFDLSVCPCAGSARPEAAS